MDNLEEIDIFLDKYNLPKLNQKEMENLNRLIASMEIKVLIKNLPANKAQDQMASRVNSYSSIPEKINNPIKNNVPPN